MFTGTHIVPQFTEEDVLLLPHLGSDVEGTVKVVRWSPALGTILQVQLSRKNGLLDSQLIYGHLLDEVIQKY